jgi:hypothetical protein
MMLTSDKSVGAFAVIETPKLIQLRPAESDLEPRSGFHFSLKALAHEPKGSLVLAREVCSPYFSSDLKTHDTALNWNLWQSASM